MYTISQHSTLFWSQGLLAATATQNSPFLPQWWPKPLPVGHSLHRLTEWWRSWMAWKITVGIGSLDRLYSQTAMACCFKVCHREGRHVHVGLNMWSTQIVSAIFCKILSNVWRSYWSKKKSYTLH